MVIGFGVGARVGRRVGWSVGLRVGGDAGGGTLNGAGVTSISMSPSIDAISSIGSIT